MSLYVIWPFGAHSLSWRWPWKYFWPPAWIYLDLSWSDVEGYLCLMMMWGGALYPQTLSFAYLAPAGHSKPIHSLLAYFYHADFIVFLDLEMKAENKTTHKISRNYYLDLTNVRKLIISICCTLTYVMLIMVNLSLWRAGWKSSWKLACQNLRLQMGRFSEVECNLCGEVERLPSCFVIQTTQRNSGLDCFFLLF